MRTVVKRIGGGRDPEKYRALFTALDAERPPLAPALLHVESQGDCLNACFAWCEGVVAATPGQDPDMLYPVLGKLLERLRNCLAAPPWRLDGIWLERLTATTPEHGAPATVLAGLRAAPLDGRCTLAHGDFSLQNLILTPDGPVLIDWEDPGIAPEGFDAGWLLALSRADFIPPLNYARLRQLFVDMGFPAVHLDWYCRLGLLRLFMRVRELAVHPVMRAVLRLKLERILAEEIPGPG